MYELPTCGMPIEVVGGCGELVFLYRVNEDRLDAMERPLLARLKITLSVEHSQLLVALARGIRLLGELGDEQQQPHALRVFNPSIAVRVGVAFRAEHYEEHRVVLAVSLGPIHQTDMASPSASVNTKRLAPAGSDSAWV